MGSKVFNVFLCIFLVAAASVLLLTSQVTTVVAAAARELMTETSTNIRSNVTTAKTCRPPFLQCCDVNNCKECCGHVVKANADKT
ncbi:hypothetical protein OROGR_018512 [Orobanche gracilis]